MSRATGLNIIFYEHLGCSDGITDYCEVVSKSKVLAACICIFSVDFSTSHEITHSQMENNIKKTFYGSWLILAINVS